MRREVILAIAIGFAIGLLIAAGLLLGRKTIREKIKILPKQQTIASPAPSEPSPSPISPIAPITLTILSPEDESIIGENKVTLKGQTEPEAIISVIYEEGEALGEADKDGNFDFEIPLIGGANKITITAYNPEGEEKSETITAVYTTAEI